MKKRKAVIIDIDDTIAYEPFLEDLPFEGTRKDWDNFHKERQFYDINLYEPIQEVIELVKFYQKNGHKIIFLTAREDTANGLIRLNTYRFIKKHIFKDVNDYGTVYKLYMRKENDFRPSAEVKHSFLKEIKKTYNIVVAIDDDNRNVHSFLNNGITTLQVHSKEVYERNKTNG